ncbi:MAG: porin family protein [Pirellulales bacterium]|nr:porin family protein [Pirellulales bacterium]
MARSAKHARWLAALAVGWVCWQAVPDAPAQVLVELEPLYEPNFSESQQPSLSPADTSLLPAGDGSATEQSGGTASSGAPAATLPGAGRGAGTEPPLIDSHGQWLEAPGAWAAADEPWIGPLSERPRLVRPLRQESWLLRPYHIGWLAGGMFADNPRDGDIDAGNGFVAGLRAGWDLGPHWGLESQVALHTHALTDVQGRELFSDNKVWLWNASTLVYPLGETQLRPFFIAGMGLADVSFNGSQTGRIHETLFTIPFGGGVKYRYNSRLAFRLDVVDTVIFSGSPRLDDMHYLSVTGAFEWHFGGRRRRSYWPWNPGRNWW